LFFSGFFYLIHYQLVEDEEVIGTLIESNERIIAALESYDKVGLHEDHLCITHSP
jgi:hypothetical protein